MCLLFGIMKPIMMEERNAIELDCEGNISLLWAYSLVITNNKHYSYTSFNICAHLIQRQTQLGF